MNQEFSLSAYTLENAVRGLMRVCSFHHDDGPVINPEALDKTPNRWIDAMKEMTVGYAVDVSKLFVDFDPEGKSAQYNEMITLDNIQFTSLCEHHLLPFTGVAHVGYIPHERVVGVSKMARLVDAYAHRFQLQERMGRQVADAMDEFLKPRGVGVVIEAVHQCMQCRGVRKRATMKTATMLGCFMDDPATRGEFYSLINRPA